MSPTQFKCLQELTLAFSEGKASPAQIQQLSALLAEVNHRDESSITSLFDHKCYISQHSMINDKQKHSF